jgi:hypothetical protein
MSDQASFDFAPQPPAIKPWKRVRPTSVAVYSALRDTGTLAKRRAAVLRAVAAIRNATQMWPTACEVQRWLAERGEIPNDGNPNHVKPRLSELADGWHSTRMIDGKRLHVKVYCDVLVRGPKRKSAVTNIAVLTWQVRAR